MSELFGLEFVGELIYRLGKYIPFHGYFPQAKVSFLESMG